MLISVTVSLPALATQTRPLLASVAIATGELPTCTVVGRGAAGAAVWSLRTSGDACTLAVVRATQPKATISAGGTSKRVARRNTSSRTRMAGPLTGDPRGPQQSLANRVNVRLLS